MDNNIEANRVGQVTEQMDNINGSLIETASLVSELENRLNYVLTPVQPQAGDDSELEQCYVPLANQLKDYAEQILEVNSRLKSIIKRLEL